MHLPLAKTMQLFQRFSTRQEREKVSKCELDTLRYFWQHRTLAEEKITRSNFANFSALADIMNLCLGDIRGYVHEKDRKEVAAAIYRILDEVATEDLFLPRVIRNFLSFTRNIYFRKTFYYLNRTEMHRFFVSLKTAKTNKGPRKRNFVALINVYFAGQAKEDASLLPLLAQICFNRYQSSEEELVNFIRRRFSTSLIIFLASRDFTYRDLQLLDRNENLLPDICRLSPYIHSQRVSDALSAGGELVQEKQRRIMQLQFLDAEIYKFIGNYHGADYLPANEEKGSFVVGFSGEGIKEKKYQKLVDSIDDNDDAALFFSILNDDKNKFYSININLLIEIATYFKEHSPKHHDDEDYLTPEQLVILLRNANHLTQIGQLQNMDAKKAFAFLLQNQAACSHTLPGISILPPRPAEQKVEIPAFFAGESQDSSRSIITSLQLAEQGLLSSEQAKRIQLSFLERSKRVARFMPEMPAASLLFMPANKIAPQQSPFVDLTAMGKVLGEAYKGSSIVLPTMPITQDIAMQRERQRDNIVECLAAYKNKWFVSRDRKDLAANIARMLGAIRITEDFYGQLFTIAVQAQQEIMQSDAGKNRNKKGYSRLFQLMTNVQLFAIQNLLATTISVTALRLIRIYLMTSYQLILRAFLEQIILLRNQTLITSLKLRCPLLFKANGGLDAEKLKARETLELTSTIFADGEFMQNVKNTSTEFLADTLHRQAVIIKSGMALA